MFSQLLFNGLVAGSIYCLVALGFGLIYGTLRFFHFVHGAIFTLGPYLTHYLIGMGIPIYLAIPFAICLCSLSGCLIDITIYRPLRSKGSSSNILFIASLGIYISIQNLLSLSFGDATLSIRSDPVQQGIYLIGARITHIQVTSFFISVFLFICCFVFLNKTRFGKIIRAVSNDNELAKISGVEINYVFLGVLGLGSTLASISGILVALDVDMIPSMGMKALMMGIIVVIVGGAGSLPGIVFASLLLGFIQNLGVYYISSQWQDAIAFTILLIFLLYRPQGFLGKELKKVTV